MAEAPEDNELGKELAAAFDADMAEYQVTPAAADELEKPTPPAPADPVEEPKNDPGKPAEDPEKKEEPAAPTNPAEPPKEDPAAPETPETPEEPAAPTPLTEEGVRKLLDEARLEERNSGQSLQTATQEVMEAYYPEGLSNVLVDQSTGKELRTPKDVVDASGGDMNMEEAAQWLLNEQFKLDNSINDIKKRAEAIAETTVTFKRDAVAALTKYQPLFTKYPQLQEKAFNLMMRQVEEDKTKGVILKAPDVLEFYDDYLEPYQKAYEFSTNQPPTNPTPAPVTPPPATPGIDDRLDIGGDGGQSPVDDPNDFAQQVTKELSKGF